MAEFMRINFEEMEDRTSENDKMSVKTENSAKDILTKFKATTESGALKNNVRVASEGMQMITDLINGANKIMKDHTNEILGYEKSLVQKANEIEIPQDFLAENSMEVNEYNYSLLEKLDGTAVTEGKKTESANDIDEMVVAAANLADITKDATQAQELDESTVIGKSVLRNIVKEETQAQELDATSNINAQALGDINNGNVQTEQAIDESTVIGKSVLGNINSQSNAAAAAAVADMSFNMDKEEKEKKQKEEQEELVRPDFEELIPSDE